MREGGIERTGWGGGGGDYTGTEWKRIKIAFVFEMFLEFSIVESKPEPLSQYNPLFFLPLLPCCA